MPQPAQPLEQSDDMTAGVSAWQWHWSPGTHCWQCRGHSRPDGRIGCWSRCRAGGGQPRRANDCPGWRCQYWNGGASNGASHRRPSDAAARGVSGEHGWHSCVGHVTLARIGSGGSDCRRLPGRAASQPQLYGLPHRHLPVPIVQLRPALEDVFRSGRSSHQTTTKYQTGAHSLFSNELVGRCGVEMS